MTAAARTRALTQAVWIALALAAGCGDSADDAVCLPMLPRECAPEPDPPTYPELYENIFSVSCGTGATGTVCHGRDSSNGLVLAGIDTAYEELLGHGDDRRARVIEENPECSPLVQRLESDDPAFWMPRSPNKLNERELCAVRQWIAKGAKRDED